MRSMVFPPPRNKLIFGPKAIVLFAIVFINLEVVRSRFRFQITPSQNTDMDGNWVSLVLHVIVAYIIFLFGVDKSEK